jgi:radical SAM protein
MQRMPLVFEVESPVTQVRAGEEHSPRSDASFRYEARPLLVYWEATQACGLSCRHCRAESVPHRHAMELSTYEAMELVRGITRFGDPFPHLVITGGDPMERPDLLPLISYARALGLAVSVTPAGTPRLTPDRIAALKKAGVTSLALSLDGASALTHDVFRGVDGSFAATVAAGRSIRDLGIPLQINTLVTAGSAAEIEAMYELVAGLGTVRWALFFLVQVGRGRDVTEIDAFEAERLMVRVSHMARRGAMVVKTTEAHHYRRILCASLVAQGMPVEQILRTVGRGFGIRDGNGIVFVSHTGEVFPSGFLPWSTGNVRRTDLPDIYRHSPRMVRLRDVDALKGKCGVCEYREICGGSRSRAFAATGDPMESDPLCPYVPSAYRESPRQPRGALVD